VTANEGACRSSQNNTTRSASHERKTTLYNPQDEGDPPISPSAMTLYRRQSMAQLYEKLRAQDDDDDMAWLAQFSPEEKPDTLCIPVPSPYLSSLSSASTSSPSTGGSQAADRVNDAASTDTNDDVLTSDSESEAEPLHLGLNFDYPACGQPSCPPLLL